MPVQKLSIRLIATLAIFIAMLFVTGPWAAAQEQVLHSFNHNGMDGIVPDGGVIFDAAGNVYSTTWAGGTYSGGTVFELTPQGGGGWTEKVLYSFGNGTDGAFLAAGLIFDTAGNLYGTTAGGGTYSKGTVFELTPQGGGGWTEKVLYSFNGNGTDGYAPYSGLVFDGAGNLYGTAYYGGTYSRGTVFELTPQGGGGWTEKVLHSFGNGTDASAPFAGLTFDSAGNLFGTTEVGGASGGCAPYGCGTVFELTPGGGGTWTEKVVYSFGNGTDGTIPKAGVIFDAAGNLYGTTYQGGTYNLGALFELTPLRGGTWTEQVLHNFGNGTDGANPYARLIFDSAGNLYGTTYQGGSYGGGTVFRFNAQGEVLLQNFSGTDGAAPVAGLVLDTAGNLYGTTSSGGASNEGAVFEVTSAPPVPYQFVTIAPCRLIDTRQTGGPIQGGSFRTFPIPQEGGCNIPATATAYSLNVTVVPMGHLGYITMWPAGIDLRPLVSTLNSVDGRVKADAAIVPAGTNGGVNVYATNTTNVILDINGYFAPVSGSTLEFYPLPPCRVADTRNSDFPTGLGPPSLTGGVERQFPILNATLCNIPSSAAAYSLNLTVVPHGTLDYLTAWPTGQNRPTVSTLNDVLGNVIANAAIVVAGTGNDVSAYATDNTDLIIDINGYFAPAGTGGLSLYTVAPCRVIDTRHVGNGQPFSGTLNPPVNVGGSVCGTPATAQAYVFNATVVPTGSLGYLTLWPDGTNQPTVSTLNASDGFIASNMAIVPSTNGKVDAFANGITQLVLDISAYFAP
jgi:uncharacterized repeat protein (TIGR03803 family)